MPYSVNSLTDQQRYKSCNRNARTTVAKRPSRTCLLLLTLWTHVQMKNKRQRVTSTALLMGSHVIASHNPHAYPVNSWSLPPYPTPFPHCAENAVRTVDGTVAGQPWVAFPLAPPVVWHWWYTTNDYFHVGQLLTPAFARSWVTQFNHRSFGDALLICNSTILLTSGFGIAALSNAVPCQAL